MFFCNAKTLTNSSYMPYEEPTRNGKTDIILVAGLPPFYYETHLMMYLSDKN